MATVGVKGLMYTHAFPHFVLTFYLVTARSFRVLHLIVIQSLKLWQSQYLVSCIMSNKFEISIRLSDIE